MNPKRLFSIALILAGVAGVSSVVAQSQGDKDKKNKAAERPMCVVMEDDPINFRISSMTEEGPVYFCCKGCVKKFEKDPKKYAERVKAQREALAQMERVQVSCPVAGEPVNRKVFAEKDGQKVYFCCEKCKAKYEKEPAKYAGKLLASYSYQTTCPVMGEAINPKSSYRTPGGDTVYFCCDRCIVKFEKEHETYNKELAKQGLKANMKKPDAQRGAGDEDEG